MANASLHPPVLPTDLIPRPDLVELVDRSLAGPLAVISAPAGFGKTTLLAAWAAQCPDPVAWLSIEQHMSLKQFVRALAVAIRRVKPEIGARVLAHLQGPKLPSPGSLAARLEEVLEHSRTPLFIVLDDYQLVTSPDVHEFIAGLTYRSPPNVHLAIATRSEVPAPFSVLRARGAIVELGKANLRFNLDETRAFLRAVFGKVEDEDVITSMVERTEGWPAGLRLAALVLREQADRGSWSQELLRGSHPYIRDFLIDDVLATQPRQTREILLRTSILDRFCAQELEALLAIDQSGPRGAELLDLLARSNLFVEQIDRDGEWYRYHHLFREALQEKLLAEHDAEAVAELHSRAVWWLEDNGLIEEAIRHALAAEDLTRAARLVEDHAPAALDQGDWEALEAWLDLLPPTVRDQRPALLVALAWTLQARTRYVDMGPVLNAVERLLEERGEERAEAVALRAEAAALRSMVLSYGGEHAAALALAEQAQARLPHARSYARGFACHVASMALQRLGRADEAVARLVTAVNAADWDDYPWLYHALLALGRLRLAALDLTATEEIATRLVLLGEKHQLAAAEALGHLFFGLVCYDRNELRNAEEHFQAAVTVRHRSSHVVWTNAILGLALTHQAQGKSDQATLELHELEAFALRTEALSQLATIRSFHARVALLRGDLDLASHLLRGAQTDSPRTTTFETAPYTRAIWLLRLDTEESLREAMQIADKLDDLGQAWQHHRLQVQSALVRALAHQQQGSEQEALRALDHAVGLAGRSGLIRKFVDLGSPMERLLRELADQRPARDVYLDELIRSFPHQQAAPGSHMTQLPGQTQEPGEALTWREREVLELLSQRLSNKEIAERLVVSPLTVKRHTIAIYRKLRVQGRREAVVRAVALQLLPDAASEERVAETGDLPPQLLRLVQEVEELSNATKFLKEAASNSDFISSLRSQSAPRDSASDDDSAGGPEDGIRSA